eukprot:3736828-Pleurochrysis_carterae.AAC.1
MQLEEEGAVGEAGAVVRGPAEADREAVTKLFELEEILTRFETVLKARHNHELAPPRGLSRNDAEVDE